MSNLTPTNIQTELNTLSNNINGIKQTMIEIGIPVSEYDALSTYANKISTKNTELVNANEELTQINAGLNNEIDTLESANETLTEQNTTLTNQNNDLTTANTNLTNDNETLTGYLTSIKQALVAQGVVTNSDAYSTYADKIGEIEMGGSYRKVLINNGTNGWYLIDDATNWVKLNYIYTTNVSDFTSTYIKPYPYDTYSSVNYCFYITLPFTFTWVKPQIILNNVSGTTTNDKINLVDNYYQINGLIPLQMTFKLSNVSASKNKISDIKVIKGYIDAMQMNRILVIGNYVTDGDASSGYKFSGNYVYMYAEGMIEG